MRKLFIPIICLLTGCLSMTAQNLHGFLEQFQILYNKNEYKKIYHDLLSDMYKQQMSEEEWNAFMTQNMIPYTGNIDSISVKGATKAILYCERMILDVEVYLDKNNKAEGLLFQPHRPESTMPVSIHSNNKMETSMDKSVEEGVQVFYKKQSQAQLSLAFIDNGKVHYYHYAPEGSDLPHQNSLYEIGSVTKTYTGLMIAQAVIENKLSLDDDIRKYMTADLSNLEFDSQPVRIRHLLTHTSGLPRLPGNYRGHSGYSDSDPYRFYSEQQLLEELKSLSLKSAPGTQMNYSNFGYSILGYILMQVYQKDLEDLFNEKLGNSFKLNTVTFEVGPELLKGYDELNQPASYWTFDKESGLGAAGGIKSTVKDLAAYIQLHLKNVSPAVVESHRLLYESSDRVAYAWMMEAMGNDQVVYWHNGGTAGFTSFVCFNLLTQKGIVILNNTGQSVDELAMGFLAFLLR